MDMQSDTAVNVRKAKSVSLKTTGHEKDLILSACADEKKI